MLSLGDLVVVVGPRCRIAQGGESGEERSPFELLICPPGRLFTADRGARTPGRPRGAGIGGQMAGGCNGGRSRPECARVPRGASRPSGGEDPPLAAVRAIWDEPVDVGPWSAREGTHQGPVRGAPASNPNDRLTLPRRFEAAVARYGTLHSFGPVLQSRIKNQVRSPSGDWTGLTGLNSPVVSIRRARMRVHDSLSMTT